jgi:putative SOS response-associated peptidase YedK
MCGRYVTPSQAEIAGHWQLTGARIRNPLGEPLNAVPDATLPMLRLDENGHLEQVAARWGLIPLWWKEEKPPKNTFNAPSEEAATRPLWSIPASKARCLVPAIGWYEWKEIDRLDPSTGTLTKATEPYFIRLPDRQPFAFAGLMSRRAVEGGPSGYTFTILTRDSIGRVADIHARMPIVLPKDAQAAWLYRELTDAAVAVEFAREQALTEFFQHPLDLRAGTTRTKTAASFVPFANPA